MRERKTYGDGKFCAGTQFHGEPLQRGRKVQGVGKYCGFRRKSPSILETVRDRPMVAMER